MVVRHYLNVDGSSCEANDLHQSIGMPVVGENEVRDSLKLNHVNKILICPILEQGSSKKRRRYVNNNEE